MIDNNIGYIILESEYDQSTTVPTSKTINGKMVGRAILQTGNERNRNGRMYRTEDLANQLIAPRTTELLNAGYLRSEVGHPIDKDLQRQSTIDDTKTCSRFLKLWMDNDNVMGEMVGTNNEYGRAFDLDLKEGCRPAWSLRALGSVKRERDCLLVENLRLITYDQVIYPSHQHAYLTELVTESAELDNKETNLQRVIKENYIENKVTESGIMIPITNENVMNFLKKESSNLKFIRECFDFAYTGINVNESGTKVMLTTNDGETLVINMESYVHNELMNYATDFGIDIPRKEEIHESFSILDEFNSPIKDFKFGKDVAKNIAKDAAIAAGFTGALTAGGHIINNSINKKLANDQSNKKEEDDSKVKKESSIYYEDGEVANQVKNSVEKAKDSVKFDSRTAATNIAAAAGLAAAGLAGKKIADKVIDKATEKKDNKKQVNNESIEFVDENINDIKTQQLIKYGKNAALAAGIGATSVAATKLTNKALDKAKEAREKNKNEENNNESFLDNIEDIESIDENIMKKGIDKVKDNLMTSPLKDNITKSDVAKNLAYAGGVAVAGTVASRAATAAVNKINDKVTSKDKKESNNESFDYDIIFDDID